MSKRTKKIQPWPWLIQFRQYDGHTGRRSRPRIVDATGKPVNLSNVRQATLAAMAPVLLDRLGRLTERAEMLHLQLQSALAMNVKPPIELVEAQEAVRAAQIA